jgi:NADH-quinone oxidoreductase subunit L
MTSFYSWRLMFMTFYGESRAHGNGHGHGHDDHHGAVHDVRGHDDHGHHEPHESPMTMLIPLGVLALGAVFSGMLWYKVFFGEETAVRDWFGMEAAAHGEAHSEAAPAEGEAHADAAGAEAAPAEGTAVATDDHATEAAPTEAPTLDTSEETAPAEEVTITLDGHGTEEAGGTHAATPGVAPKGAILMLPFTPEEQAVVDPRLDADMAAHAEHAPTTMINAAHVVPAWVKVSPFIAMLIGLGLAWLFYIRDPSLPVRLAAQQRPLYLFLLNKWYFDELYDVVFVRPAKWLGGFLWKRGDGNVIDGSINGVALGIIPFFTRLAGRAQSGYLFHYAFAMVLGIVILVTWMTLFGGAK